MGAKGFTLLELMLTMAILVILTAAGGALYRGYVWTAELGSVHRGIINDLSFARTKASQGEGALKWGVHFVNGTNDYYEVFSTPTVYASASTTVGASTTLPVPVSFTAPPASSSTDVLFTGISGTTTAATISIVSADGDTRTVTVSSIGTVY